MLGWFWGTEAPRGRSSPDQSRRAKTGGRLRCGSRDPRRTDTVRC